MIKRFCLIIFTVLTLLIPSVPVYASNVVNCANYSGGNTGGSALCTDSNHSSSPIYGSNGLLVKIANIVAFIAGVAAVILILVGSIQFITSGGDSAKVSTAKSTIVGALIGLAIIVLGATLINFVLGKL